MNRIRHALVVVIVGTVAGSLAVASCSSEPDYEKEMRALPKLARGEYLAKTMGCGDCHTPGGMVGGADSTRELSGSEIGWAGPWGVTFARNLTPDVETGLGSWDEKDIVRVLKVGQRPDGSPVLPPMPWPTTAMLTDADAAALAMYLMSIPAVSHKVPDRIPPGAPITATAFQMIGPPPAWDVQHLPPPSTPGTPRP